MSCVSRGGRHVFLMPGVEQRPAFLWRVLNEHASYPFRNDGKRLVGVGKVSEEVDSLQNVKEGLRSL